MELQVPHPSNKGQQVWSLTPHTHRGLNRPHPQGAAGLGASVTTPRADLACEGWAVPRITCFPRVQDAGCMREGCRV